MLQGLNVCSPEEEAKCKAEIGVDNAPFPPLNSPTPPLNLRGGKGELRGGEVGLGGGGELKNGEDESEAQKYFQWACEQCEKKKRKELHPWTQHLLRLRRLQKAGYPFEKNDLTYDEWMDLGLINERLK